MFRVSKGYNNNCATLEDVEREIEKSGKTSRRVVVTKLRLTQFPRNLPLQITSLCLQNNDLQIIPESLALLKGLQTLNLRKNSIEDISVLCKLPQLTTVMLDDNMIRGFPSAILGLQNLMMLTLEGNPLPKQFQRVFRGRGGVSLFQTELKKTSTGAKTSVLAFLMSWRRKEANMNLLSRDVVRLISKIVWSTRFQFL